MKTVLSKLILDTVLDIGNLTSFRFKKEHNITLFWMVATMVCRMVVGGEVLVFRSSVVVENLLMVTTMQLLEGILISFMPTLESSGRDVTNTLLLVSTHGT